MAKTFFSDGNPLQGILGTIVNAAFLNKIFNHRHDGLDQDGSAPLDYAPDSGAANTYVIALTPALTGHVAGLPIHFKATNANTGASTLTVNGLAAVAIKQVDGTDLPAGAIVAGQMVTVIYTGTVYMLTSATITPSEFIRTLLDDADAATARATLGLPESGLVHQLGRSVNTITATYTAIIPFDGTTPLISDGTTILSVTAAASRSTSRIRLQGSINAVQTIAGLVWIVTVYKDSTLLNVYISPATSSGQTAPSNVTFFIDTLASDTNSHTYSVNIGVASYGVIINPSGLFSANTSSCYLSVDEVTL